MLDEGLCREGAPRRSASCKPPADAARVPQRSEDATAIGAPLIVDMDHRAPVSQDPPHPTSIGELCDYLGCYLPNEAIEEIYRAYLFGAKAHSGQIRKSGEPYIHHPIEVARILAEMGMDHKCLVAALLHDVIEDTAIAKEQLAAQFDEEIAELVDGVSKLTKIDFKSRAEAQAASLTKMLLAMTKDIRVIMIKLADRLHNMRTLGFMDREQCRRKSRETLEIYAPIANRLGIESIRLELEELSFAHYWPWRHRVLEAAVSSNCGSRVELIADIESTLGKRLNDAGIDSQVVGRKKHLYGIYSKMRDKKRSFSDVVDVFAFRVIVDRVDTCYRVLGYVHNLYKPVPGRFKDYIAIPKANGYQSLHTVLFGPQGVPVEIQIRTADMHRVAESGIAAHWTYKSGDRAKSLAADWLQSLVEVQRGSGDSVEFLEHVKVDLFPDEVYVFTPRGRIHVLPRGATVVDFAYAIHSDVGNTCIAARIERRLVPLNTELFSGQTVDIINAPGARPNPAWLTFVVTGKARANVRAYLKNLRSQEAQALGKRLLDAELSKHGSSIDALPPARINRYLGEVNISSVQDLLADVGLGNRMPALIARCLMSQDASSEQASDSVPSRLSIKGTEGMVVTYGRCCRPIPGDKIVGMFSPGKGVVVHRQGCRNLGDYHIQRDKWLDIQWDSDSNADFSTEIRVELGDRRGALATVATTIADMGSNIENVESGAKDGSNSTLGFVVSVKSRQHLARIMRRLRRNRLVLRIYRVTR